MNGGRYGVIQTSTARKWGYHPPVSLDESSGDGADKKGDHSPTEIEAYTGRSVKKGNVLKGSGGGCAEQGRSEIFGEGGLEPTLQYLLSYHENSFTIASHDVEAQRAMENWSKCMKRFGLSYNDMWEANNDPKWQTENPTSLEKGVAEKDVVCKRKSKVLSVLLRLEKDLQNKYMAKNSRQFAEIRKYRDSVEQRARQVLERASAEKK